MITEKEFKSLFDDTITKKEYDEIIRKIDNRFSEICQELFCKNNKSWYDYDTGGYEENNEGRFIPEIYKEEIFIIGENIEPPPGLDYGFPTSWLWNMDYKNEVKQIKESYLESEKKKKKQKQIRLEKINLLKNSIKNKLTEEELKIIKFK